MSPHRLRLVEGSANRDTVEELEHLLAEARAGQLVGLAYVAMYKGREYTATANGECRRNPTFTRGMLRALDDALADMVYRL